MVARATRRAADDSARRSRRWILSLAIGGLGVVAALWGLDMASRLAKDSPRFQLRTLEIRGLHMLREEDILAASGLSIGDNIFAIDPAVVRVNLERLPWVRTAAVWRLAPDRLAVHIRERRRAAWVRLGKMYSVDAEGVVLPGTRERMESCQELDLPVIGGVDCGSDSLRPGMSIQDSVVISLLRWWNRLRTADEEFSGNVSES